MLFLLIMMSGCFVTGETERYSLGNTVMVSQIEGFVLDVGEAHGVLPIRLGCTRAIPRDLFR